MIKYTHVKNLILCKWQQRVHHAQWYTYQSSDDSRCEGSPQMHLSYAYDGAKSPVVQTHLHEIRHIYKSDIYGDKILLF